MMEPTRTRNPITFLYLVAVGSIYLVTSCAWLYLGAVTDSRTRDKDERLRSEVGRLWGGEHSQVPPTVSLLDQRPPPPPKPAADTARKDGETATAVEKDTRTAPPPTPAREVARPQAAVPLACQDPAALEPISTTARADLDLEHRRKGLLWYSTYAVRFDGTYTVENPTPCVRPAQIWIPFPATGAVYDEFSARLDGKDLRLDVERDPEARSDSGQPARSGAMARVTLSPNVRHQIRIQYRSRGLDRWSYALGQATARARGFSLVANTNFDKVDFPASSLSPSFKRRTDRGWQLTWQFGNLLADSGITVLMPQKLNPGPLAAEISRFAPVSLFFFFFVLLLVSVIRQVRMHPVHFGMLAAAFFSFHLLMAYLVDHVPLWAAFLLASVTSVALVVSYLRLAIGPAFAILWAGGTQILYLVLFSLAFFLEGYTGLTITIFSVLTLFVVMQLTARIDWSEKLGRSRRAFQPALAPGMPMPAMHPAMMHPAAYGPMPYAPPAPWPAPAAPSPEAPPPSGNGTPGNATSGTHDA